MWQLLRRQWFVCAIILTLLAAWLSRSLDFAGGRDPAKMGFIMLIFLASGISLRTRQLAEGLGQWRLHGSIQVMSLLLAPLLIWCCDLLWRHWGMSPGLRLGFIVLAALPTTITSCVVLTGAAGGNRVAALINATVAEISGVFVTPLWLLLLAGAVDARLDLLPVLQKLLFLVLLPLAVGQILQAVLGERLNQQWRKRWGMSSQVLLLGVLYLSFHAAFNRGEPISLATLAVTLGICAMLHLIWLVIPWWWGSRRSWTIPDHHCAIICASQKTLALWFALDRGLLPQPSAIGTRCPAFADLPPLAVDRCRLAGAETRQPWRPLPIRCWPEIAARLWDSGRPDRGTPG